MLEALDYDITLVYIPRATNVNSDLGELLL